MLGEWGFLVPFDRSRSEPCSSRWVSGRGRTTADGGAPLKPEFPRAIRPDPVMPRTLCLGTAPSRSSAPSPARPSAPRQAVCSRKLLVKLVLLLLHIYDSSQEGGGRSGPQEVDEGLRQMGDVSWPHSWLRGVWLRGVWLLCRERTHLPTLKGAGAPQALLSRRAKHRRVRLPVLCSVVSTGRSHQLGPSLQPSGAVPISGAGLTPVLPSFLGQGPWDMGG